MKNKKIMFIQISLYFQFFLMGSPIETKNQLEQKYRLLFSEQTKQNIDSLKKQICTQAKPAIAITTMGMSGYLLGNTLKAAIDLQKSPQKHTQKGLMLNAAISAGFLLVSSYLFKNMRDEKTDKENITNDHT